MSCRARVVYLEPRKVIFTISFLVSAESDFKASFQRTICEYFLERKV